MYLLYNLIAIPFLYVVFRFAGVFNSKIKRGIVGRRHWQKQLVSEIFKLPHPRVWIHSSSYGEFEQARPVLERLKIQYPKISIVVTFFSPSAYEYIPLAPPVDYICYLPFDTKSNAQQFIEIVKPAIAIIVRHDIWPNFLHELTARDIPTVLMDASIPATSSRLWPILRGMNKTLFKQFSAILPISNDEKQRFQSILGNEVEMTITGDTKYDQVIRRAADMEKISDLVNDKRLQNVPVWVVGSSWPSDEKHILPAYTKVIRKFPEFKMIIAPHEITESHLADFEEQCEKLKISTVRYSQWDCRTRYQILIIDVIGLLAHIYGIGTIAFVGGSMEQKVHNVLEPAAHGIPVLFGPCYDTQAEAVILADSQGGRVVHNVDDMADVIIDLLENPELCQRMGEAARNLVMAHAGAAEKTVDVIAGYLRHTSEKTGVAE
ncbi:3-deoxy-D-manno-octulosonic acid transferase [candidate division KSB1 bacterium]|nr:3-deoxy-D-manno-octulosonic acid transferase [candidate division KSB1 bacterium]